jgi:hypothetical protein
MQEKKCTSCGKVKGLDEYRPQKTNPRKLYAWCFLCQQTNKEIRHKGFQGEYAELRAKGRSMSNLTEDKVAVVKELRSKDLNPQDIAAKLGVPEIVVRRTLKKLDMVMV